jgi:HSP20 family protein
MIRIRRVPTPEASDLHRRMEQVMESLLHGFGAVTTGAGFVPRADIHETSAGIEIILDLAGVTREDIDIVIEGRHLHVAGTRQEPQVRECLRYHQMEISYGAFERIFHLPEEADAERVTASYRDGFLQITVPLRPQGEARQVPVDTR